MRWTAAGCAAGFVALALPVAIDGGPLPGDRRVLVELRDLLDDGLDEPLVELADLTDLPGLVVLAVAFGLVLIRARRWRDLAYAAVAVGGVWAVNPLLKDLFERARPDLWAEPMSVSPYSFPSGHGANTAALAAAVVLAFWPTRRPVLAAATAVVLVVGIGQVALGVHYPSDLVAGWLWAVGWVAAVWSVGAPGAVTPRRAPSGRPPPPGSGRSSRS